MAIQADRNRDLGGSLLDVKIIGTFAPKIIPASVAPAKYSRSFARIFPETMSGTRRISAEPETGLDIPFVIAADFEMALSKAKGPSTMAPII